MTIDPTHKNRARNLSPTDRTAEGPQSASTRRKPSGPSAASSAGARMTEQVVADHAARYASLSGNAQAACARLLQPQPHAAGRAVESLARKLDGHGGDLAPLVKEFQGASYRSMGGFEAANKFAERAIKQFPQLADPIIALKMKGLSAQDRQIVQLALVGQAASGWYKYAAAVHALNTIHRYSADERGDLLGIMKEGRTSLAQAAKMEDAELKRIKEQASTRPASLESLQQTALANANAELAACNALNDKVRAADKQVRDIDGLARAGVGAIKASAFVGNLVLEALDPSPASQGGTVRAAGRAGAWMAQGEFNSAFRGARASHGKFNALYLRYCELNARYQHAIRNGDSRQAAETGTAMSALVPRMQESADASVRDAARVGKLHEEFEADAIHGAKHLAVSAVTAGVGGPPGEHLIEATFGHAASAAYGAAVETATTRVLSGH